MIDNLLRLLLFSFCFIHAVLRFQNPMKRLTHLGDEKKKKVIMKKKCGNLISEFLPSQGLEILFFFLVLKYFPLSHNVIHFFFIFFIILNLSVFIILKTLPKIVYALNFLCVFYFPRIGCYIKINHVNENKLLKIFVR